MAGHPDSGLRYQESMSDGEYDGRHARVIKDKREIVSPSRDFDSVWMQYKRRVARAIGESE
ncbi:hypothetical protein [Streptomyces sp. Tu6071]|uniref:hypothetical protein n=1 Tax=Streptomyces sp. Tu6071 TaxID=355249 RepID=UPI00131A293A|nr:hypothetical protein [Streptomyces sp. Tu6071]